MDEQTDHNIMHLNRLGKADRFAHQTFNPGAQRQKGSGQNDVHAVLGMSTILPATLIALCGLSSPQLSALST
jgi:hypothetical protein